MDPIETWHDAPEFERMDAKLSTLIGALEAIRDGEAWNNKQFPSDIARAAIKEVSGGKSI